MFRLRLRCNVLILCLLVGCSLFHVVVDTDDISTKIIRYLTADKGGRVTFIPLNRVRPPHVNYPTGPDVVPLLKKLKFNSKFGPAFAQVQVLGFFIVFVGFLLLVSLHLFLRKYSSAEGMT